MWICMKYCKRLLSLLLCLVIFVSTPLNPVAATLSESISEKEAAVSNAKKEVASLKSGLTDVKALKAQLESSKKDLNNYIAKLDGELSDIQDKIKSYSDMITQKEADIEQTQKELEEAEAIQTAQYEAMKKRIKFLYEKGDTLYLELFFQAQTYGSALNKADYVEMLSAYDKKKLEEYIETTEYVAACKEELEAEREVLKEAKKAVEEEEKAIEDLLAEKEQQVYAISADISTKEAAIKEYEAQIAEQNAEIAALEKAIAEEKARLAEQNRRVYNGGMFTWPCPSYTRISDNYGNRVHPILGVNQFHNGIDLAAPGGASILAAYDGDVVAAAYNASMGNYIMIDHGSGLYTIYMHASALYVSKGQAVSKGQTIAAVGSTGRSTGNHLHFSVRLNGSYVSPWNYLK